MRRTLSFAVSLRKEGEVLCWRRLTILAQPQVFNYAEKCQGLISGIFAALCRQPRRKTWALLCLFFGEQTRLLGAVRLLGTHAQVTPQNLDGRDFAHTQDNANVQKCPMYGILALTTMNLKASHLPVLWAFRRSIRFPFNEAKATEVAAHMVERSGGNALSHLALMKMLYIVDREALRRWERPVIGGKYCSMEHGTVISEVLDLMRKIEGIDPSSKWTEHLTKIGNEMRLVDRCPVSSLSPGEVRLIDEVFDRHGNADRWELRDLTHGFKEWENVGKSSKAIRVEAILRAVGKTGPDINRVAKEAAHLNAVRELIGAR